MPTVEVRNATKEDVERFKGSPGVGPSFKAMAGLIDGKPIAIGGLAFASGVVVAFADVTAEAKKHPVQLHRTALKVMADAKAAGHRVIYAKLDENEPTAARWLARLGFKPVDGKGLYLWQA